MLPLQKYDEDNGGTLDRAEFQRLMAEQFEPKEPAWRAESRRRLLQPKQHMSRAAPPRGDGGDGYWEWAEHRVPAWQQARARAAAAGVDVVLR